MKIQGPINNDNFIVGFGIFMVMTIGALLYVGVRDNQPMCFLALIPLVFAKKWYKGEKN